MAGPNISFEVQFLSDKNWLVAELMKDEAQARLFADSLLRKGNHAAVRVVRDYRRLDGTHQETVIHHKLAESRSSGADLSLGPVGEVTLCQNVADLRNAGARGTLNRVFRKYLDEMVLTPTEILHSAADLKRLGDKGTLLYSAMDRISTAQAQRDGSDGKERRDQLHSLFDQAMDQAKRFAAARPAVPKDFADLAARLRQTNGDPAHGCLSLICLRLLECRSWSGKLDVVLDWTDQWADDPPEMPISPLPLLDGVVADILYSAQFIQDLLGFQSNLGTALHSLADLCEGKATPPKQSIESFARLNQRLGKDMYEQAKQVILQRLSRELGGQNPLSRNEPSQEYEVFQRLAQRLTGRRGMLGGAPVAEALLHRVCRIHAHLDRLGMAEGVELCQQALADNAQRVMFLLTLMDSPVIQPIMERLQDSLKSRILSSPSMEYWTPVRLPPPERMAALASIHAVLIQQEKLPAELRDQLAAHVDQVLAHYLVQEEVIEKIDRPDDPLALRAIRLIKFCGSGVLIPGQSLNLARQRVIGHLRQPQFEAKFLSSVGDPSKAEGLLREFHRLLIETGFR